MRPAVAAILIVTGLAVTATLTFGAIASWSDAMVAFVVLTIGPVWALAYCLASDDDDFASAERSRSEWLGLIPWTFLLAPLVVPNIVILGVFLRDSRADGGRSIFTWDRMRPGEGENS